MTTQFTVGQTIDRMVYTKKNGETKAYSKVKVDEVHPTHIIATKETGEIRRFNLANIKSPK